MANDRDVPWLDTQPYWCRSCGALVEEIDAFGDCDRCGAVVLDTRDAAPCDIPEVEPDL